MDPHALKANKSQKQLSEKEKVLVDASLFLCMQREGLKLSDISSALHHMNRVYTTSCTIAELTNLQTIQEAGGSTALQFASDAKDFGCGHGDAGFSSVDCITSCISTTNSRQYIVATDSEHLLQKLETLPGIRFICFGDGVLSLKNPLHQEKSLSYAMYDDPFDKTGSLKRTRNLLFGPSRKSISDAQGS